MSVALLLSELLRNCMGRRVLHRRVDLFGTVVGVSTDTVAPTVLEVRYEYPHDGKSTVWVPLGELVDAATRRPLMPVEAPPTDSLTEPEKQVWRAVYAQSMAYWLNEVTPRHVYDSNDCPHLAAHNAYEAVKQLRALSATDPECERAVAMAKAAMAPEAGTTTVTFPEDFV